ncbi:MAG: diaminopimelate epimerase [Oscillospiraceae bacterium]|nr:diaminopimelate epimerase [Oscillospiraceae bacterium]
MKFSKMQGAGNDYVYVNCFEEKIDFDISKAAIKISDRHFGRGSDGMVLICPSDKADFEMIMYNSDGSRAEMCGNAVRCVGKYVYDKGLTDKDTITVETLAGIKTLQLSTENGKVKTVRVNMGAPVLVPKDIPVNSDKERFIDETVNVGGIDYKVTCVSMGNPHAVVFLDTLDGLDIEKTGPLFENHSLFPRRINTEFVEVIDRHTLKMRVWERGAGETLACGTGSCASMVAAVLLAKAENKATLKLLGGDLVIEWAGEGSDVFMTGPAEFVFDGEIQI